MIDAAISAPGPNERGASCTITTPPLLLLGLAVVLQRAHAAPVGHADDHRHVEAALGAVAVARGVVLDLVEALEGEAGELDLAHGLEPVEGHPDRRTDDAGLGQRAVDD